MSTPKEKTYEVVGELPICPPGFDESVPKGETFTTALSSDLENFLIQAGHIKKVSAVVEPVADEDEGEEPVTPKSRAKKGR